MPSNAASPNAGNARQQAYLHALEQLSEVSRLLQSQPSPGDAQRAAGLLEEVFTGPYGDELFSIFQRFSNAADMRAAERVVTGVPQPPVRLPELVEAAAGPMTRFCPINFEEVALSDGLLCPRVSGNAQAPRHNALGEKIEDFYWHEQTYKAISFQACHHWIQSGRNAQHPFASDPTTNIPFNADTGLLWVKQMQQTHQIFAIAVSPSQILNQNFRSEFLEWVRHADPNYYRFIQAQMTTARPEGAAGGARTSSASASTLRVSPMRARPLIDYKQLTDLVARKATLPAPSIEHAERFFQADARFSPSRQGDDTTRPFTALLRVLSSKAIPAGLVNKLHQLAGKPLTFLINDHVSMHQSSPGQSSAQLAAEGTRWEAARNVLLQLLPVLAWVPTADITLNFVNSGETVTLSRGEQSPEAFREAASRSVISAFEAVSLGTDSVLRQCLSDTLASAARDGQDGCVTVMTASPAADGDLVQAIQAHRETSGLANPITLIDFSDQALFGDAQQALMLGKHRCATVQPFAIEQQAAVQHQGTVLPFTKGVWLMRCLIGVQARQTIGLFQQPFPLTRKSFYNLLGISNEDNGALYDRYFQFHADDWGRYARDFKDKETVSEVPALARHFI